MQGFWEFFQGSRKPPIVSEGGWGVRDEFEAGFDAFKTQLKPTPKKVH